MKNLKHIILIAASVLIGAEATTEISNEEIARDFDFRGKYLRTNDLILRVEEIHSKAETLPDLARCRKAVTAVLTYHLDHPLYGCIYDLDLLKVTLEHSMFASLHGKALKAVASKITSFTDSDHMPVINLADQLLRKSPSTNPEMEEVKKNLRNLLERNLNGPYNSDLLKITLAQEMFSDLHERASIALSFSKQLSALETLTSRIQDFMDADDKAEVKPVLTSDDKVAVESVIQLLSSNQVSEHPEMQRRLSNVLAWLFGCNIKGNRIYSLELLKMAVDHPMSSELNKKTLTYLLHN